MSTRNHQAEACAILFAALFPSLAAWLYFVEMTGCSTVLQQTAYTAGKVVQFGFPLVWIFMVRRQRGTGCQPVAERQVGNLPHGIFAGLFFGAAVMAVMLAGYYWWLRPGGFLAAKAELIAAKVAGFGVHGPMGFLGLGIFYCLVHSLLEEYYWRWFLFGGLQRLIPVWPAVLVSSLAFAAHHVIVLATYFGWSWQTGIFSSCVAIGGAAWAWLYHRSNSLIGPWLSHLLVDAAIFVVGYDLVRSVTP